jgi:hypothetical protein
MRELGGVVGRLDGPQCRELAEERPILQAFQAKTVQHHAPPWVSRAADHRSTPILSATGWGQILCRWDRRASF